MLTQAQLIKKARTYLQDALNAECSTHTRHSAAMSGLQCLCLAGMGEVIDSFCIELWETTRYDIDRWPSEKQVAAAIERVRFLLGKVEADN